MKYVYNPSGTTDSQGNFSITLNLGSAAGQNQYDTGVSYHYYDVDLFIFTVMEHRLVLWKR